MLAELLVTNPGVLMDSLTPFGEQFVILCATKLGTLAIVWMFLYLLLRPIPDHSIFAPFENLARRCLAIGVLSVSGFVAYILSVAAKNYFEVGRPMLLNVDFYPIIEIGGYGFPSSHAALYSALATALFIINRRAGTYATLLALIVGAARILAGVHTPLDIFGGYLLGTTVALTISGIVRLIVKHPRPEA